LIYDRLRATRIEFLGGAISTPKASFFAIGGKIVAKIGGIGTKYRSIIA